MPVSTREERRQQRKQERQAAQRRAVRGAALQRNLIIAGIAVVVVALAVLVVMMSRRGGAEGGLPGTRFDDPVTNRGALYEHVPDSTPITADPSGHYPPLGEGVHGHLQAALSDSE